MGVAEQDGLRRFFQLKFSKTTPGILQTAASNPNDSKLSVRSKNIDYLRIKNL